jgi:hypothetical protein
MAYSTTGVGYGTGRYGKGLYSANTVQDAGAKIKATSSLKNVLTTGTATVQVVFKAFSKVAFNSSKIIPFRATATAVTAVKVKSIHILGVNLIRVSAKVFGTAQLIGVQNASAWASAKAVFAANSVASLLIRLKAVKAKALIRARGRGTYLDSDVVAASWLTMPDLSSDWAPVPDNSLVWAEAPADTDPWATVPDNASTWQETPL